MFQTLRSVLFLETSSGDPSTCLSALAYPRIACCIRWFVALLALTLIAACGGGSGGGGLIRPKFMQAQLAKFRLFSVARRHAEKESR